MTKIIVFALSLLIGLPAWAQEQQEARAPAANAGAAPFDMVAADRETAWRINRQTGEVLICRINTTAGLDTVAATCVPATMGAGGAAQQSRLPAEAPGGTSRP